MAPVIQAISLTMAKAAVAITGSAAVGNFFIAYGFQTLVVASSVAYSSVQQRKMRKALDAMRGSASTIDQGRNIMVRDPIASRRIIYGQCLLSGPLVFMHASGTNNEYLHLVVVLASHEVEEIGDIYFNDELVPLSGNTPSSGVYQNHARVKKFLGAAAGERDTDLESESGGIWTSAHLGKGIARLHVRLKYSTDVFPNGIPVIKALVKGKKVYDPRTATTAWSANAALCVGDFLMDTRFGKGIALVRIRDTEWEEAANICDEDVTLDDLSTEKRYTCNGTVNADQDPNETLLDLAGAMAGHVCDAGGLWTIRAGAWRTPGITLTDSDLAGPFSVIPRQSRQDTYNGVRGTFISSINQWAPADFPVIKNDTYMAKDGGVRLWKDVAYNFTTSAATAQRLAKIDLEAGRQQIICTGDHMLKAMQCQPGDVIAYTRPNLGWSTKYFEVIGWGLKLEIDGDRAVLKVALTVKETAEGIYDWNDGEETTVDLAPNTTLYNPRNISAPTGLTLSTSNFVQQDGTITPRIQVQWDASTDINVLKGGKTRIEYKKSADSTWLEWAAIRGDLEEDFITGVEAGVGYDVQICYENVQGVRSTYVADSLTVSVDTAAPATPTGLIATPGPGCNILDWADNTEDDLDHYEVYRNTTNTFPGGSPIWTGYASQHADFDVTVGATYYYWLKAADTSDNLSSATASVNSAALDTTGPAGADGADGLNNATVFIYKRAASTPTLPSATTTYTFATGVLAGLDNGWTQAVPANDGNPLYVAVATASAAGTTDTIASGEWASPVVLASNGAAGAAGLNAASVFLYKRAASTPSVPSTTSTYTFATGVLTGHDNGWTQSVPTNDGNPLWVITATAASTSTTDTIATGEWASPAVMAENGSDGADGADGGYTDYKFQRASSAPSAPTGDNPAGWYDAPPAADGNPLYMIVGDKTAAGSLVGSWSTPVNTDSGLVFEYSVDGSTSWHSTFTTGDLFARHKVIGGSFTSAYRIVGEDGTNGTNGADGNFRDTVYKRAATIPSTPTGNGVPSGWDRSPPAADGNPLWMSTATKTAADVLVGSWSTPVRITGDTGATGPALSYSLTIDWHGSGLGGGYINGTYYSGTSTTVTGLNPGAWVDISADANVSGDNWTSWGGADTDQLESGTGTNSNRILMGGNLSLIANY